MRKIRENICPQNSTCVNVKNCRVHLIEELGYGFPAPMVENGKCSYCEKCTAVNLTSCCLNKD